MIKLVIALMLVASATKAEESVDTLWGGSMQNQLVGFGDQIGSSRYLWSLSGKPLGYLDNSGAKDYTSGR